MVAIRAIYDGENFKPLPTESMPQVEGEVPVAIIFLNGAVNAPAANDSQQEIAEQLWAIRAGLPSAEETQGEIAARMRARRDAMPPLEMSIPEMIEEGRDR